MARTDSLTCPHCGKVAFGRGSPSDQSFKLKPALMTFDGGALAVEKDALGYLHFTAHPDERTEEEPTHG